MNLGKILVAGLLGGLVVMIIAFALHRPPLDDFGWSKLADEKTVQSMLASNTGRASGIYSFPTVDSETPVAGTKGDDRLPTENAAAGSGLILYLRPGEAVDPARAIIQELFKTLAVAMFAAFLAGRFALNAGYAAKAFLILAISTTGSISTHISYNAWFGFPVAYTLGRIFLDVLPWIVASLVIAALLPGTATASRE